MYTKHSKNLATSNKNTLKTKRILTPEQVSKVDESTFRRTAKKGMDFAQYAYNWLLTNLYPYYQQVVKNNLECDVQLIEDNSGAHTRTRAHLASCELQEGIQFALQLRNSPNMHPIKRSFTALKGETDTFVLKGQLKAEKLRA